MSRFSLSSAAPHLPSRNKGGFGRIPFRPCGILPSAKPPEANDEDVRSEPALLPDLEQELHTPAHLVCRRGYSP